MSNVKLRRLTNVAISIQTMHDFSLPKTYQYVIQNCVVYTKSNEAFPSDFSIQRASHNEYNNHVQKPIIYTVSKNQNWFSEF